MNIFLLIIQIIVVCFLLYIYKNILKPPVFLAIVWLIPIAAITIVELFNPVSYVFNEYALVFPLGCILFSFSYSLFGNKHEIVDKNKVEAKNITIFFKFFIIFELVLICIWVFNVYKYVQANFKYNFWYTYKWGISVEDYYDPFYIPYLRTGTRVISCIMLVNFLKRKNNKDNKWFFLQLFITIVLNFLGQGRGGIFSLFIPLIVIYLLLNNDSKRKIRFVGTGIIILLIGIFFVYASMKDPYTTNNVSPVMSFENYLCGGLISFCNWAKEPIVFGNGIYTFRFVFALLNSFGFDVEVVSLVEEYVENIHGNIGNVYTFYKWYANDFGVFYALIVQMLLGMIYGLLSKKLRKNNSNSMVVLYAIMFYPLFMQFFNDQYFSNFSIWIQIFFWIYLFNKTNIFMINKVSIGDNNVKKAFNTN